MVAEAEDVEAGFAENDFARFDLGEGFAGDGSAGGESRGETGLGGLGGGGEPGLAAEFADIGLGEADVAEGSEDRKFGGGLSSGTELKGVIGIFAVGEMGDRRNARVELEFLEEFVFAEVATIGGIGGVVGVIQLGGGDDFDGPMARGGEIEGVGEFLTRQAGGIGNNSAAFIAEFEISGVKEISAIDAAGIGDEEGGKRAELGGQLLFFLIEWYHDDVEHTKEWESEDRNFKELRMLLHPLQAKWVKIEADARQGGERWGNPSTNEHPHCSKLTI